jgi:hypothetical protein
MTQLDVKQSANSMNADRSTGLITHKQHERSVLLVDFTEFKTLFPLSIPNKFLETAREHVIDDPNESKDADATIFGWGHHYLKGVQQDTRQTKDKQQQQKPYDVKEQNKIVPKLVVRLICFKIDQQPQLGIASFLGTCDLDPSCALAYVHWTLPGSIDEDGKISLKPVDPVEYEDKLLFVPIHCDCHDST